MWVTLCSISTFVLLSRGFLIPTTEIQLRKRFEATSRKAIPLLDSSSLPLAFVNRYAETFDVLVTNLQNQEAIRLGLDIKMKTPLASQPPGTGKTALGINLITVLKRKDTQADISQRLMNAWSWQLSGSKNARSSIALGSNVAEMVGENVVMQTLGAMFPYHINTLKKLKASTPIVCRLMSLKKSKELDGFDDALGFLLFSAATGSKNMKQYDKFVKSRGRVRDSQSVAELLIKDRGPILIVLDDITDLALGKYADYFKESRGGTSLHRAMAELSAILQLLHSIPECFVYCTGQSLWLSTVALMGGSSPLRVTPIMLQPMTAEDAVESMKITPGETPVSALSDELGVDANLLPVFAKMAVRVTGGIGRAMEYLIRARQQQNKPATSRTQLSAQIEALFPTLKNTPGLSLQIKWDGPVKAAGDIPVDLQNEAIQLKLIRLFCRALLLDASFSPSYELTVGNSRVRMSDAAVVFGLSFSPVESTQRLNAAPLALRLVAGEWLCRSLLTDSRITSDPSSLAVASLLGGLSRGTMKGRPFEFICVDSFFARVRLMPGSTIRAILPHLAEASISSEILQNLHFVAIPKVTRANKSPLSDAKKARMNSDRSHWTGSQTINPADLPWLLCEWLEVGAVAVPANAQSGSQDWFIRVEKGVIGIANQAVKSQSGTKWGDLKNELSKAPKLYEEFGFEYTLIVWTLNVSPELSAELQNSGALVCKSGPFIQGGKSAGSERFTVPDHTELVVVNPKIGISELIGVVPLQKFKEIDLTGPVDIQILSDWEEE